MAAVKMRIEGAFLRSAVARRIFFLFVLSALVPVMLLAALSYGHVRSVVTESAQRQLAQASGAHGRSLYDRLLGARFVLAARTVQIRGGVAVNDVHDDSLPNVFLRVVRDVNGQISMLSGSSAGETPGVIEAAAASHLATGEVAVLLPRGAPASNPWLAAAIAPGEASAGVLMAELDPKYLWGDRDELSNGTEICVFASDKRPLYCSGDHGGVSAASAGLRSPPERDPGDAAWMSASSMLFLRAQFGAPEWTVVALRPSELAMASLTQVVRAFLGVTLLTLLLVAFLSVLQIRRTLVPLEHLIEGARRFAREDFAQPIRVARNDEFGQLGHSMNHMASRLARQIGAMRALSDIDQKILTQLDIKDVIEGVHARLRELLPRCIPAVFVFDDRQAGFGTVHIRNEASEPRTQFRVPIQIQHLTGFQQCRDGVWLDVDGPQVQGFVSILAKFGADHCLALPIASNGNLDGVLLIGMGDRNEIDNELIQQASDLASRVGVALGAHAREAQLVYRAHHDDLTGLPNRALLQERLQLEMARARRNGAQLAVLFLDLDRFKAVNDTLGHQAGDQVLRDATERLRSCLRDCDTVARFGGDEFVVLLSGVDKPHHAAQIAGQILSMLAQPFSVADDACFIGASIGVAMFPTDGATTDELLRRADIAMYKAKAAGRGRFVFSEESMNVEQRERSVMERELRKAVALGQLTVLYQPRVDLRDGRLCGAEALVRWHHPELGWVSPAKFVPLAEDLGLVSDLGAWILRHVCEQLVQWQAAGHEPGTVSVNVSAKQFTNGKFVAQVADIILSTGVATNALQLEITEGVLIENHEFVISMLERIKKTGVSIALDDFGTGYSSISYLRRLPVDVLKIDQSFIQDMAHDADARSVVQAIIGLARSLRKTLVAEGVETEAQAALLRQWGCDEAQGYHFGRPLTPEGLRDNMGKHLPLA